MATRIQLIGTSSATRAVLADIACAAASDAKVLITGESGVGKEVAAQLIHHRSRRGAGQLIAINCAGVPDSLLASELFGHVRGSFTDAYRDKQGWLEQAHGGTMFMDEVGEMSLQMQAALLRFLENGEIQRVGADRRSATADVRIIAATNRKLIERVAAKEFREDLFYRLNVIHIEIPPLRERPEDVAPLVHHFLGLFRAAYKAPRIEVHPEAMEQLFRAPWPGNVRQLRNVLERLVVNARGDTITASDLPREVLSMSSKSADASAAPVDFVSRELFRRMVQDGECFWTAVYEPFMSHDLTRENLRAIVREGLIQSRGGYKAVAALFNVPEDYRRLMNFLRKHDCQPSEQDLRRVSATMDGNGEDRPAIEE
jgi:DNA-binding NtrC family response regulator